jgi:DNA primase
MCFICNCPPLCRDCCSAYAVTMINKHNTSDNYRLALSFHQQLPDRIRAYLHSKGIPDPVICRYRLGWNGDRITIPITNKNREVVAFKLAKEGTNRTELSHLFAADQADTELYGWERVVYERPRIVICEGEIDRLILEAHGFPAVTSMAGAGTFLTEWAELLKDTPEVFVCFHNSAGSYDAAAKVSSLIPGSRIVELPQEVGLEGTIEDYFVRLRKTNDEFESLLDSGEVIVPKQGTRKTNSNE